MRSRRFRLISRPCLVDAVLLAAVPALVAAQQGAPPSSVQPHGSRYSAIRVRSCPLADKLLGPLRDDAQGAVRGYYDSERDTSYFETGIAGRRPEVTSSTKFTGRGPVREPVIRIVGIVRGDQAEKLAEESRGGPVRLTFVLDDSVTIYPASWAAGRLEGEANARELRISALLKGEDLIKVAAAQIIVMRVGLAGLQLSYERNELRALIRVVVCPR